MCKLWKYGKTWLTPLFAVSTMRLQRATELALCTSQQFSFRFVACTSLTLIPLCSVVLTEACHLWFVGCFPSGGGSLDWPPLFPRQRHSCQWGCCHSCVLSSWHLERASGQFPSWLGEGAADKICKDQLRLQRTSLPPRAHPVATKKAAVRPNICSLPADDLKEAFLSTMTCFPNCA